MAEYIVTLSEGADPNRVCVALGEAGLVVRNVFGELGMVTGMADSKMLGAIEKIPEVLAVEPSHEIQLPSPDEELQ